MIKISLTPEEASELKDCKVGEKLTGTVTKNDDTGFEMDVEEPESEDPEESKAEGGEEEEAPKPKSKAMGMILGQ